MGKDIFCFSIITSLLFVIESVCMDCVHFSIDSVCVDLGKCNISSISCVCIPRFVKDFLLHNFLSFLIFYEEKSENLKTHHTS